MSALPFIQNRSREIIVIGGCFATHFLKRSRDLWQTAPNGDFNSFFILWAWFNCGRAHDFPRFFNPFLDLTSDTTSDTILRFYSKSGPIKAESETKCFSDETWESPVESMRIYEKTSIYILLKTDGMNISTTLKAMKRIFSSPRSFLNLVWRRDTTKSLSPLEAVDL